MRQTSQGWRFMNGKETEGIREAIYDREGMLKYPEHNPAPTWAGREEKKLHFVWYLVGFLLPANSMFWSLQHSLLLLNFDSKINDPKFLADNIC